MVKIELEYEFMSLDRNRIPCIFYGEVLILYFSKKKVRIRIDKSIQPFLKTEQRLGSWGDFVTSSCIDIVLSDEDIENIIRTMHRKLETTH